MNKRDLPWRHESDPYRIWLSEVILQQTQVAQGLSYYLKFVKNYPTVSHLAKAAEDKVLKDWQGLGYYSRARNLHAAAKGIAKEKKGMFPRTFDEIKQLKGVGDYTAAAIASFAYNLPHAVVDGNVYRVLSRVFGIETPIDSTNGKRQFKELASGLLDKKDPATYNQAVMEFGSQYCRPVNPDCRNCIFSDRCFAFKTKRVDFLPLKAKRINVRERYINYVIMLDKKKNIILQKRGEGDIWQGLYEFKLIESNKPMKQKDVLTHSSITRVGKEFDLLHESKLYKHVLSHQRLHAKFYVLQFNKEFKKPLTFCNNKTISRYAFPRLIERFINDYKLTKLSYF